MGPPYGGGAFQELKNDCEHNLVVKYVLAKDEIGVRFPVLA